MPVVKILSRHSPSYESLLKYILKVGKPAEHTIRPFTHNIRSTDVKGMAHEFKENESYRNYKRRNNSILIYHEIISFSTKDKGKINREVAEDIARKYMELRGHMGMFVGAVHEEKDNIHIHIASSGLHFKTGKAFRLSRADLQKLKQDVQKYHIEKYPEISHSACGHGMSKPYTHDKLWFLKRRNDRKAEVERIVAHCLRKASTQKKFLALLLEHNLPHYERSQNQITGVIMNNTKFRFKNLNIDMEQLQALPVSLPDEQRVIREIEALRKAREKNQRNSIER